MAGLPTYGILEPMSKNGEKRRGLQVLILIGVAVVAAALVNLVHPKRIPWVQDWAHHVEAQAVADGMPLIQFKEVLAAYRTRTHLMVDARSADEYRRGHIPGSVSLPLSDFENLPAVLAEIMASEKSLIFYCSNHECDDSLLLALEIRALGRNDISVFIDGYDFWRDETLSVEGEEE